MEKINLADLAWEEDRSPKGVYQSFSKEISKALGAGRNARPKSGHPFDLELVRIPPGKSSCPFHSHTTQHELFLVLSGEGTVRLIDGRHTVKAGDAFIHPPGEAHQIINSGREDLVFYVIADNPPVDAFYYPDSGKWGLRPHGKFFRATDVDYYDGEE